MPGLKEVLFCLFALSAVVDAASSAPWFPATKTTISKQDVGTRSFIFGTVTVYSPKAPPAWTETDCMNDILWTCPDGFRLVFLRPGDPTPIIYRLTGDGSFKIPLDPGEYYLAEWGWHLKGMAPPDAQITGAIGASFSVSPGSKATYVGDLNIVFADRHYYFRLEDRLDQASASLLSSYPHLAGNLAKSLLEMMSPPVGEQRVWICDASWGARCDETVMGVEPVQPAQAGSQFSRVTSLSPTLEWKRVGGEGITYDVAVYEVLPYGAPLRMNYVQGPMVEYAEGLSSTSYTVTKPLKPDSYYFWSVRLRKGKSVSDWSSMSYRETAFLIFAFRSELASDVPFRFKTP